MSDFYQELINKMQKLVDDQQWLQLNQLVDEELSMPYIPHDFHDTLLRFKQLIPQESTVRYIDMDYDSLEKWLNGDYHQQVFGLQRLTKSNVREYLTLILNYLCNIEFISIGCLLIDLLIEQNINQDVSYNYRGKQLIFNPSCTLHPYDTVAFNDGWAYLNKYYLHSPDKGKFAQDLWLKEAYFHLPGEIKVEASQLMLDELTLFVESLFDQSLSEQLPSIDKSSLMIRMFEI
jgi:hypothetical protein